MGFGKKETIEEVSPEVVLKARGMLTARGSWMKAGYKGTSKSGKPTRCLIQAVNEAGNGKKTLSLVVATINDLYGPSGTIRKGPTYSSIQSFNDSSTTGKVEVLNVLDEAYKRAGGKEPEMGTMQVMDPKAGDRHVHWDPTRPEEVEDAKASFDFLVKEKGYFAYMVEEVKGKFKSGKQVKTFDPSIGRLILRPALVGG